MMSGVLMTASMLRRVREHSLLLDDAVASELVSTSHKLLWLLAVLGLQLQEALLECCSSGADLVTTARLGQLLGAAV